ncbi:MAG: hypothetical protein ACFFB3_03585, partial [Candidatus Hodarchaeota archaeon]
TRTKFFNGWVEGQILILALGLFFLAFMPGSSSSLALKRDMSLTSADASFIGEDFDDRSGYSVAGAGDVNGDGYADILIGGYGEEEGGDEAGKTYLILGRPSAQWSMDMDLSQANASFIGENTGDWSAYSVAGVGDVNNDNYDDILIGAPYEDTMGNSAGKTYLILGRSDVTAWNGSDPLDLSYANASFIGEAIDDYSGYSVAGAGDVNSDDFADILIGAYGNDEGASQAGKTYLILGRSDVTAWNDSNPLELSYANASFLGKEANEFSGDSVAGVEDVNGDGYDDILIGAPNNNNGGSNAGKTYLILGRSDVTTWNDSGPLDLSYANASFIGEDADDQSGISAEGPGDVNGDGYFDVLIGAWNDEEGGPNAGKSYLILGRSDVTTWNDSNPLDLSYANASFIGEEADDYSGCSVAGADMNFDGYADILIGAPYNDHGASGAGKTYLILGRSDVTAWNGSNPLDLSYSNVSFMGEGASDLAGWSIAGTGDVNNDGFDDILIGAHGDGDGGNIAGQTYLVLGEFLPMANRLHVTVETVDANNITITVRFVVEDTYGRKIDEVQMWVSNGTYTWTGVTNEKGQFNVTASYTMDPFNLEVNATKDSYLQDLETFVIHIEPVFVGPDNHVPEWNFSLLTALGLIGIVIVVPGLAIWRQRRLRDFSNI